MAVTVYTSDDAGAPVLDGTNGSLINLLDKCLVTGYGSKAAVGWSKPFADTQLGVDPYWSNVVFQMKMDGYPGDSTFVEDKGAVCTVQGNTKLTDISPCGACSALFDGTGDYLRFPGIASYALGTGDFTIEFWVSTIDTNAALVDYWANGVATSWQVGINATGYLYFYVNAAALKTSTKVINNGEWHHVAICRTSGIVTMWIDGVQDGAGVADATNYSTTQTYLSLGGQVNSANSAYDFSGMMDNVRITKGVARYTSNFMAVPTSAFADDEGDVSWNSVVLRMKGDTLTDERSHALTTVGSMAVSTSVKKFGYGSLSFPGASYLTTPAHADWDFGTGDFTVELWVRFTSHTGSVTFLGNYLNSTTGWTFQYRADAGGLRFGYSGDTAPIDAAWTPVDGQWYHLALCRASGNVRMFVDGVQIGSTVANAANIAGSTQALSIGALFSATWQQHMIGHMDDIRVTKGVGRYTTNFSVPTYAQPVALTGDTSAASNVLLMHMNGANADTYFVDERNHTFTGTNAILSTTQAKWGSTSAYFNGTSAYIDATPSADFSLSGQFTVEYWIWVDPAVTAWARVLEFEQYNVTGGWHMSFQGGDAAGSRRLGVQIGLNGGGGARLESNAAIPTSQWVHIAVTRNASNVINMFVNGVVQTASITSSENYTSQKLRFGSTLGTASNFFLGYIDDVRITKGVARNTTTFVPKDLQPLTSYTNSAVYRMPDGTSQCYLRVEDFGSYASCTGYRGMTDASTGTNAFPPVTGGNQDPWHNYVSTHVPGTRVSSNHINVVNDITGRAITAAADAKTGTGQGKFYSSSMVFDGNGDYFYLDQYNTTAGTNEWNMGTGSWTIEAWVYIAAPSSLNAGNTRNALIASVNDGWSGNSWEFLVAGDATNTGTGVSLWNGPQSAGHSPAGTFQAGWNHVAFSKNGGTHWITLNGTSLGSATNLTTGFTVYQNTHAMYIGGRPWNINYYYWLDGYLQDFRLTKGAARYCGTSTAPQAALPVEPVYLQKSRTADSTARKWWLVSNGSMFHLFVDHDGTATTAAPYANSIQYITFGKYNSWVSTYADTNNCILRGGWMRGQADDKNGTVCSAYGKHGQRGAWFSSTYDQQSPVPAAYITSVMAHTDGIPGLGAYTIQTCPSAYDGKYWFSPVTLTDAIGLRGNLPGIWAPCHNLGFKHGQVVSGTGDLANKQFMCVDRLNGGQLMVEISDTW